MWRRFLMGGWVLCGLALLVGCAGQATRPAPVEDRRSGAVAPAAAARTKAAPVSSAASPAAATIAALPGAENAGKPGFYTVRQGDTLIKIGLDQGQNWRDLVRWNGLDNPNVIEVGQVLRVSPPNVINGMNGSNPANATSGEVVVRPVAQNSMTLPGAAPASGAASAPQTAPGAAASAPQPPASSPPAGDTADEGLGFIWPATGPVLAGFEEPKNKGIDLGGKAGDPVLAAADGRVVYSGSGLRGYGNLVIIKHNNTFLTAYAHNQTLLVKEDQAVKRGQKIAEMGNTDTDQVKLHFEIRRQGKPVDPARYLPATR